MKTQHNGFDIKTQNHKPVPTEIKVPLPETTVLKTSETGNTDLPVTENNKKLLWILAGFIFLFFLLRD